MTVAILDHPPPRRLSARGRRITALGLLLVLLGLLTGTSTAAAAPVRGLDNLPTTLQKYAPGSDAWKSSPWMTATACQERGGDFGLWVASIVVDTPELLSHFQSSVFGVDAPAEVKARGDAILAGYRRLPQQLAASIPRDYCVDDLLRWAGRTPDTEPFGFPWGVTSGDGHQTSYYCTDRDGNATRTSEDNRFFGAERVPCDGVYVSCDNAQENEKTRCQAWNAFSDDYVRRIDTFRAQAIKDFPAQATADVDVNLKSPDEIAQDVADSWFSNLTETLVEGAATVLAEAMSWYVRDDRSEMLSSPAIGEIQSMLSYVGLALLTAGVIWQGILMMYRRKADPLISTGMGLLSYVAWSSLGGTLAILIHQGGIALSDQVLDDSIRNFSDSTTATMLVLTPTMPGAIFGLALILLVLACIQWAIGFVRIGALVVLLALLPTAAAGQMTERTKPWLPKVLGWCLALDVHQPVSAVVLSIGFVFIGEDTGDGTIGTVLVGCVVLGMAVLSMPTLLKFFDWGGQQLTGGGGGGGGMAMGAAASMLGGGGGAGGWSRFMDRNGPAGPGGGGDGDDSVGALPVSSAHEGEGPGGGDPSSGGSGPQSTSGGPGDASAGDPQTGSAGSASQAGPETGVTSATGVLAGAAAGGAGVSAVAGPIGAVATEAAGQATDAVAGAMVDGAGESGGAR